MKQHVLSEKRVKANIFNYLLIRWLNQKKMP